ncbi:type I DNA topoisomerase [Psychromonas sp. psych-6C06]|uniref:type I DNA topoisomerase n=1 Tax=Psychromonas sp. psych-6C06 TaxID=2058089 RepID=UPI000C323937|nr:type I DNA topoisomerase [Psychromonas sp. psych-6C06]PKF63841.1 type I DNA topoisomerase [Psychromonas sp. psych-6C06]
MSKSLVIVESPAKAKTINKYLGKDFIVKSSVGHIRDLPTSGSAKKKIDAKSKKSLAGMTAAKKEKEKAKRAQEALVTRMGIDPNNNWKAHYEILPGKEKVVSELQKLAIDAPTIYLASDLDREGEAIAWHLKEILGGDDSKFQRVVFNEITESAIQEAFNNPTELNLNSVKAQQTRRFLDRVVGFMVSPLLWKKVARGLSAGRVQSVAVRLLVERERLIKAFNPDEYWDLHAQTKSKDNNELRLEVFKEDGVSFKPTTEKETNKAVSVLQNASFKLLSREDKPTKSKASAPFITSTLQQAASTRLSFGVKKTMMLAQRLYEAGYITYMRTDSTNLSKDAVASARDYINAEFGSNYLPKDPVTYSSKSGAQEAHEAIRPSDVTQLAALLVGVDRDAMRLYELIWRQFLACQMLPALYDATTLVVEADNYLLRAKGRTMRFAGWTKAQPVAKSKVDEVQLPDLAIGEKIELVELEPRQHFTKPPARFTEAALVKELEKQGIGRPSTYASIISTIQDRGYVKVDKRRFYAVKMGEIVSDRLSENFVDLMSYDFTAEMEANLDAIAEGKADWIEELDRFYKDLTSLLEKAELPEDEGGMRLNEPVAIKEVRCPTCEREMGIRTASTGVFLGCSGYALPPKERCKTTINLVDGEEVEDILSSEDLETAALMAKKRCPKCDMAMDSYLIDEKRKLHVCGNNPICDGHIVEQGEFKIKGYDGPVVECDKCGNDMQLKDGRFGKYMGCTNEECKNTRKILRNGEVAPPKEDPVHLQELPCEQSDAYFILRDGASGLFLAASTFPRSRETRAPKVAELAKFKDRISPKFHYLAQAPQTDPNGNPAVVRYSRKNKEQYVMTEIDKKATGWTAKYVDAKLVDDVLTGGKWVEEQTKKRAVKKKKA